MNKQRLEQLLKFYDDDPDDPFVIYAIATEYASESPEKARTYFEMLLEHHPSYIPTYYHAAHMYIDIEALELAKKTFETGLEKAKAEGDDHALQELQNAYQNFLFEYE